MSSHFSFSSSSSSQSSPLSKILTGPPLRKLVFAVLLCSIPLVLILTLYVTVPYSTSPSLESSNLGPTTTTTIYTTARSKLSTPWAESSPVSPSNHATKPSNHATLTFDSSSHHQSILGFGGAFTEAAALNFDALPPSGQEALIEALFGSTGLGYSLGRTHMNSCDFSVASYDFDSEDGDFQLSSFDTSVGHDAASMIPFMKRATEALKASAFGDDLKIIASPWSPPAWMKENGSMLGSAADYCLKSDPAYAEAWASYFAAFLSAYKGESSGRVRLYIFACERSDANDVDVKRCIERGAPFSSLLAVAVTFMNPNAAFL